MTMTFVEFLRSEQGRRVLNHEQADRWADYLEDNGAEVHTFMDLSRFVTSRRHELCPITDEEKRAGHLPLSRIWSEYQHRDDPPMRSLFPRGFARTAHVRGWRA
jgi:hypothetical protein